jgi:TolB-like protein/Tfp pilus assembly protein PilF
VSDIPDYSPPGGSPTAAPAGERLESWKEIAAYLSRSVRTVKRWERVEGLPVRRHLHRQSSSVWAFPSELDAWTLTRQPQRPSAATPQAEETVSAEPTNSDPQRRWIVALVTVAATAIMVTGIAYLAFRDAPSGRTPFPARLAVLPMVNLSGDPREEYLSDGLTEDMIAELGAAEPAMLSVVGRTSAMHYKHTRKRVDEIARELGVDYVLEGSVRRMEKRIRITAQLIDARTQRRVWAEQYERDTNDILSAQTEVVRAIGRAISARLAGGLAALRVTPERRPIDPEALHLYLRGLYESNRTTAEGFRKAIELFTAAIERDPSYARAHAELARTYAVSGNYGMMPDGTSHQRGRDAALKALEIDDTLAEAHAALGTITSDYYWDWAEAERRFKRAIELNPSYATAYHSYSFYLGKMGRFEEALAAARRAQELDPLSLGASANVGVTYFLAHRNEEAITHLRQTLDIDPKFGYAHLCLGLVHVGNGAVEPAIREFEAAKTLTRLPNLDALLAYAWARSGDRRRAEAILGNLGDDAVAPRATPYHVALVYTALGDRDRAFSSLHKAIDGRESFVGMLKTDPLLDPLRSDSRFGELLQRVGLTP